MGVPLTLDGSNRHCSDPTSRLQVRYDRFIPVRTRSKLPHAQDWATRFTSSYRLGTQIRSISVSSPPYVVAEGSLSIFATSWIGNEARLRVMNAVGMATPAGGVPVTGTATYCPAPNPWITRQSESHRRDFTLPGPFHFRFDFELRGPFRKHQRQPPSRRLRSACLPPLTSATRSIRPEPRLSGEFDTNVAGVNASAACSPGPTPRS